MGRGALPACCAAATPTGTAAQASKTLGAKRRMNGRETLITSTS
jgi:hypothetical protein